MVDPVRMFVDGGPFMYLLLPAPSQLVLVALQLALARRFNLMPLLWCGIVSR